MEKNNLPLIEDLEAQIRKLRQELQASKDACSDDCSFKTFIRDMPAIAHSINKDGEIVDVSDLWLTKMGYERNEVVGRKSTDFLSVKSRTRAISKNLPQFLAQGFIENVAYEFVKKNGEIIHTLLSAVAKYDSNGEILQTLAIITDISKRVKTENNLIDSEEKYRTLVELAQEGIWVINKEGETTFVNPSMCKILGFSEVEIIGKHLYSFMDPKGKEIAERNLKRRESGVREQHDFEFINKSGSRVYTTIKTAPIYDKNGDYDGAIAGVVDITRRKKVEFELRLIRDALENSLNAFDIVDEQGKIVYVNRAYIDMWGYDSVDEVVGESPVTHCQDPKTPSIILNTLKKHGECEIEFTAQRKDGSFFEALMYARRVYDENGREIYPTTSIDITERKNDAKKLLAYSETQSVLLREINHRVKNNLSVVISMLRKEESLGKKKNMDKEYFNLISEILHRIEGLLLVHNLLSSSNWEPLNLSYFCEEIASGVLASFGVHKGCVVTQTDIFINSDQAQSLSMILNELLTNSIKHGADDATILALEMEIDIKDGFITIIYSDNGYGYHESILSGSHESFNIGFNIIFGMVKKNLKGEVFLSNQKGATAKIIFPESV